MPAKRALPTRRTGKLAAERLSVRCRSPFAFPPMSCHLNRCCFIRILSTRLVVSLQPILHVLPPLNDRVRHTYAIYKGLCQPSFQSYSGAVLASGRRTSFSLSRFEKCLDPRVEQVLWQHFDYLTHQFALILYPGESRRTHKRGEHLEEGNGRTWSLSVGNELHYNSPQPYRMFLNLAIPLETLVLRRCGADTS